jgi:hypothetical protein
MKFLYYFICGDVFYEKIPNIQRIGEIEENYTNHLVNGNPPENLVNNEILNLLKVNNMQSKDAKIIEFNNREILFINTWCISPYLNHDDYDIVSGINSYRGLISKINRNFNVTLEFNINNSTELFDPSFYEYEININDKNIVLNDLEERIFIFNYRTRSIHFDFNSLNNLIRLLSKNYKIILSCYDSHFENNENIKFIDKDYNIYPDPKCSNLLYLWEIASKCNKIILLETGSSWTFLHKLNSLKENQLFIFDSNNYINKLNNLINGLSGENKDLVKLINNTNIDTIFTEF